MANSQTHNKELSHGKEFDRLSLIFLGLTGQKVESFFFPGLKKRYKNGNGSAVTTTRNGEKLILTYRANIKLAELEAEVLRVLSKAMAPVPNLISHNGHWLVQEFLGEKRLTQALNIRSTKVKMELIEGAILSLVKLQNVSKEVGLHKKTKPIGISSEWRKTRISFLKNLGKIVKILPPSIDEIALNDALIVVPDTFIKWDARAGNAIVRNDGSISWFDWEHCGCRSSIDDLVWFLGDEWISTNQQLDKDILKKYINLFKSSNSTISAQQYFFIHGTLHICGRLAQILRHKGNKQWWKRDYCLEFDQMGITRREARNLADKASEWANFDRLTSPLTPWLQEISVYLKTV